MTKQIIIPESWIVKVSSAVGKSTDEITNMVFDMWDEGRSIAEIEQAMILLAKSIGNTLLFKHSSDNCN